MAVGGMYKVVDVVTGVAGGPYYLTGYFDVEGGTAQAAVDVWWLFVASSTASNEPNGVTHRIDSTVPIVASTTGDIIQTATVTPKNVTGTRTAALTSSQTQAVYNLRTGVYEAGREIRGRYHRPLVESSDLISTSAATASTLTTGAQDALNTRAAALVNSVQAQWVVWSRKNGSFQPITAAAVKNVAGTLRSRSAIGG